MRLKVCRLAWNGFGTEGGLALADALAAHESLFELDISGNRLTLPVANKMAQALSTNDTLKILRVCRGFVLFVVLILLFFRGGGGGGCLFLLVLSLLFC